jgi:glutamate/tyrosine decarboxylase-like PLP-dependent enzyme
MKAFNDEGLPLAEVDSRLDEFWDMSKLDELSESMNLFEEGRHLIRTATLPWGDEVRRKVVEAYVRFIHGETWATGDGARQMQSEIVAMMGELLGSPQAAGRITTGGSESVLSAVACAKYRAYEKRYPGISPGDRYSRSGAVVEPNPPFERFEAERKSIVMPVHQHYSVFKACALFGLEPVTVAPRTDRIWDIDPNDIRSAIRDDTVAIFTTAGVFPYGTIDRIAEIGEIAQEYDLYLHVDGCFGAFCIPFLERAGYYNPPLEPWDFRVPAVCSISADFHKNGMCPPPCSLLLFRNKELLDAAKIIAPPCGVMTGTRANGPIAAAWTMLRAAGLEGFKQIALTTIRMRDQLMSGLQAYDGLKVTYESRMNCFGAYSDELDLRPVVDALREKGWIFTTKSTPAPVCIVLVPMPQNDGQIEHFLADFQTAMQEKAVRLGEVPAAYEYDYYGGIPL